MSTNESDKVDHFVFTRLNVLRREPKIYDLRWLSYRLDLFETFCLPSVVRQTRTPTTWAIFVDSETPQEALDRLRNAISPYAFIRIVLCEKFTRELAAEYVREHASTDCKWVITTRLDSDDSINARLFETVYQSACIGKYEFLNAPSGLVVIQDRFYSKLDKSNAFISASEALDTCKTVFLDNHTQLKRHAPIRQLPLKYAWMQIVHGDNIANRVRGIRVAGSAVKKEWEWLPRTLAAGFRDERPGETLLDNSVGLIVRTSASLVRWLRSRTERVLKSSG